MTAEIEIKRPETRGGCQVEGSCHFASCRYNLAIDVLEFIAPRSENVRSFTIRPKRFDFEAWSDQVTDIMAEAEFSCALDVADQGEHTLREVGAILGVTRERARQIEDNALSKLARLRGTGLELRQAHQETADARSRDGAVAEE